MRPQDKASRQTSSEQEVKQPILYVIICGLLLVVGGLIERFVFPVFPISAPVQHSLDVRQAQSDADKAADSAAQAAVSARRAADSTKNTALAAEGSAKDAAASAKDAQESANTPSKKDQKNEAHH